MRHSPQYRLGSEFLEERTQPALLSLNLPGLSLVIATPQPIVVEVAIVRTVAFEFIVPSARATLPTTTVPSMVSRAAEDPSPAVSPAIPSLPATPTVPRASTASVASDRILLPPDAGLSSPASTSAPIAALPVVNSAFLPPAPTAGSVPAAATAPLTGAIGTLSFLPEGAPLPRVADVLPPVADAIAAAPAIAVAPPPREARTPRLEVVTATEAPPAAEAPQAVAAPAAQEQPEEDSRWGWIGASAAVLAAGGYWMMRQFRSLRPAPRPARFMRLPMGTILSTDVA